MCSSICFHQSQGQYGIRQVGSLNKICGKTLLFSHILCGILGLRLLFARLQFGSMHMQAERPEHGAVAGWTCDLQQLMCATECGICTPAPARHGDSGLLYKFLAILYYYIANIHAMHAQSRM